MIARMRSLAALRRPVLHRAARHAELLGEIGQRRPRIGAQRRDQPVVEIVHANTDCRFVNFICQNAKLSSDFNTELRFRPAARKPSL
jgi:hypothetical protein